MVGGDGDGGVFFRKKTKNKQTNKT